MAKREKTLKPQTLGPFLRSDGSDQVQDPEPRERGDTADQPSLSAQGSGQAEAEHAGVSRLSQLWSERRADLTRARDFEEDSESSGSFSETELDSSDEWILQLSGSSRESSPERPEAEPSSSRAAAHKAAIKGGASATENVEWQEGGWEPHHFPFTATPGLRNAAAELQSDRPADFFQLFITDELLEHIVEQTNLYAQQYLEAHLDSLHESGDSGWKPVSVQELKQFFGLTFLTGIIQKPSLAKYWSLDELVSTPYFSKTMPLNRFQQIWKFLHFNDNRSQDAEDKMYKVRPVLDYILQKFRDLYQPGQNLCIDEGMMLWRERVTFRVYNPQKPVKCGIKSYVLCDSATGYCFNLRPYVGEASPLPEIVFYLLDHLTGQGYTVFMDNFYNSVSLCERLLEKKTHVCGTLRKNRGEPNIFKDLNKSDLGAGGKVVRHNQKVMVVAWHDKRVVKMVTTCHHDRMKAVNARQRSHRERASQLKPECVVAYNASMNRVDKLDQNISYYPFIRKPLNWSKKFVAYMFQLAMFNSFVLYKKAHPGQSRKLLDYIEEVARSWTKKTCVREVDEEARDGYRPWSLYCIDLARRLDGDMAKHELEHLMSTEKKARPSRRCRVCASRGQRSETKMWCKACRVPLHPGKCFTVYHTKRLYYA